MLIDVGADAEEVFVPRNHARCVFGLPVGTDYLVGFQLVRFRTSNQAGSLGIQQIDVHKSRVDNCSPGNSPSVELEQESSSRFTDVLANEHEAMRSRVRVVWILDSHMFGGIESEWEITWMTYYIKWWRSRLLSVTAPTAQFWEIVDIPVTMMMIMMIDRDDDDNEDDDNVGMVTVTMTKMMTMMMMMMIMMTEMMVMMMMTIVTWPRLSWWWWWWWWWSSSSSSSSSSSWLRWWWWWWWR